VELALSYRVAPGIHVSRRFTTRRMLASRPSADGQTGGVPFMVSQPQAVTDVILEALAAVGTPVPVG
jgi:hypothetical protein